MNKKNIPFQQFQIPNPGSMTGRWYKRHIVIDHRHKEIQIQLMWDGSGELATKEYQDILQGRWYDFVPTHRIDEYRAVLASGYRIVPVVVAGADDGEDHVCMQLIELTNTHNVIHDTTLAPIPES